LRTDTIFYQLFQTFPTLLMELLGEDPASIASYQFTSVGVKEKAFRFDGVFLPQSEDKTIWFVEVQFQKVNEFYSQLFSEIFLFLQQYRPVQDWGVLVLFPDRQMEPALGKQYRELQGRVRAIYLNELEAGTSVILGLVKLVVTPETEVIKAAQALMAMGQGVDGLLEFVETILVYKLKTLSREEIERMFTLGDLRQTRVYQEAKQEGRQEGEQRGCLVLRNAITKQIARKFGRVPDDLNTKLAQLSLEQLGEIAEAIIDISSLEELEHLLGCNNPS
jgi:predicted transposase/invertase (TIGR01784 family)